MVEQRWKPNVTVAAVVEAHGRFLLVEEETADGLRLNNPAGHLDCGESPLEAVVRETLEETARHFQPRHFLGVYLSRFQRPAADEDVTYLRLAYAGSVGEPLPGRALDSGIVRTVWMNLDELRASRARHRSALVLRCIEDHLAGRHHPLDVVMADATLHAPEIKRPG